MSISKKAKAGVFWLKIICNMIYIMCTSYLGRKAKLEKTNLKVYRSKEEGTLISQAQGGVNNDTYNTKCVKFGDSPGAFVEALYAMQGANPTFLFAFKNAQASLYLESNDLFLMAFTRAKLTKLPFWSIFPPCVGTQQAKEVVYVYNSRLSI